MNSLKIRSVDKKIKIVMKPLFGSAFMAAFFLLFSSVVVIKFVFDNRLLNRTVTILKCKGSVNMTKAVGCRRYLQLSTANVIHLTNRM